MSFSSVGELNTPLTPSKSIAKMMKNCTKKFVR